MDPLLSKQCADPGLGGMIGRDREAKRAQPTLPPPTTNHSDIYASECNIKVEVRGTAVGKVTDPTC